MALNKYICIGRLTADIELKRTPNGKTVSSFTVAVDKPYNKNNEHPEANFIDCIAWEKNAEFISKYFGKGSKIAITGSVQTRNYEDKEGKKRKVTEVLIESVDFVDKKSEAPITASAPETKEEESPVVASEELNGDGDLPF